MASLAENQLNEIVSYKQQENKNHTMETTSDDIEGQHEKLKNWPKFVEFQLKFREFLRAGLTYKGDGSHDLLECGKCGLVLGDWQLGDDPVKAHKTFYPECKHIQEVKVGGSQSKQRPPEHEHMMTFQSRLDSYRGWPSALGVDVWQLADAGLFYSGVGDKVICYYCDGNLKDWEADDDPWMDHAHWFPACHYVRLVQGDAFMKRARLNRKGPRITDSEVFDQPIAQTLAENCSYCNKNKKEMAYIPCGHIVSCMKCSNFQLKCICEVDILDTFRIYNC